MAALLDADSLLNAYSLFADVIVKCHRQIAITRAGLNTSSVHHPAEELPFKELSMVRVGGLSIQV